MINKHTLQRSFVRYFFQAMIGVAFILFSFGCSSDTQKIVQQDSTGTSEASYSHIRNEEKESTVFTPSQQNSLKEGPLELLNSTAEAIKIKLEERKDIYAITWSFDRALVAFAQGDTNSWEGQIYIWKVGEKTPTIISEIDDRICEFFWSPNSSYVFVDTGTSLQRGGIIISAKELKKVATIGYIGGPLWSPDSKWVVVGIESNIPPITPTELGGTVDLIIYNVENQEKKLIAQATSEFYYLPFKWDEDGKLTYRKIYFDNPGNQEYLTYLYK